MSSTERLRGTVRAAAGPPRSPQNREVRAGDPVASALPVLVERYGPRLFALALRMCRHRADAEDMVQDVFLQAVRRWHSFRGESEPGTWLHAIAARSCKERQRRKGGSNRRVPALSQLAPWTETTIPAFAFASGTSQSDSERLEAVERVQRAVADLPEHLRLPLTFKEILGLSVEDTAKSLGLRANTVKTRLMRARMELRRAMLEGAAAGPAPPPAFDRRVCADLLRAKMVALDRGQGTEFRVPQAEFCDRCRAIFAELDLVQSACEQMSYGELPQGVRRVIARAISELARSEKSSSPPRRGRKPV